MSLRSTQAAWLVHRRGTLDSGAQWNRSRANMAHTPQPRPDSGLGFQVIDSGWVGSTTLGGVPREQTILKGHLTRLNHQVY